MDGLSKAAAEAVDRLKGMVSVEIKDDALTQAGEVQRSGYLQVLPPMVHDAVCPRCGYCPHCGRGGYDFYPTWPFREPYITWTGTSSIGQRGNDFTAVL